MMGPRREPIIATTPGSSYHSGLTPTAVVNAAVDLTKDVGLFGWSLRDLARHLDVAPSVIYHHVGGTDLLSKYIVERVLSFVDFPTTVMPWRDWFRTTLFAARPVLATYPGTSKWLLLHGPVFPTMTPVIDAGIASLQAAGFGEGTVYAYSTLLNTALATISMGDDRLQHEGDGPRDHATMMTEFAALSASSPGVDLLARDMVPQFTGSAAETDQARARYFRFVVETLMDGLELRLARQGSDPDRATGA